MSFLEEQYLRRASYQFRNYKERGNHVFNWSCTICGDSAKKKNKARSYAYDREGSLLVKCYNCGYSTTFPIFLKEIDPLLHEEFVMERFKEKGIKHSSEVLFIEELAKKEKTPQETKHYVPNIFDGLDAVKDLKSVHPARMYADSRFLPLDKYDVFFAGDFIAWTRGHTNKFENWRGQDHSRIVFPFYARDGHIIGYAARALNGEEPKYYRIFIDPDEKEKFFGIDRVDESKQVYVLEGEIDSMFIPNSVAVSNGKLDVYYNPNAIYIPDADKRNPHIVLGIEKLLNRGLKVCLLPDGLPGKDINDLVRAGYDTERILELINKNVVSGLTGKLKFNKWKVADGDIDKRRGKGADRQ